MNIIGNYHYTRMLRIISWTCYLVGGALVFASYLRLVSSGVAWAGWGIGMSGWVIIVLGRRFCQLPEVVESTPAEDDDSQQEAAESTSDSAPSMVPNEPSV